MNECVLITRRIGSPGTSRGSYLKERHKEVRLANLDLAFRHQQAPNILLYLTKIYSTMVSRLYVSAREIVIHYVQDTLKVQVKIYLYGGIFFEI